MATRKDAREPLIAFVSIRDSRDPPDIEVKITGLNDLDTLLLASGIMGLMHDMGIKEEYLIELKQINPLDGR